MASATSNNSGNNYQSSSNKNPNSYRQSSDSKGGYYEQGSKEPSWLKDYKGFNAVFAELLRLAPNVKLDTRLIYMDGANNVAVMRGIVLDENGLVIARRVAKADLKVSNSLEKAETKALRRACLFAITLLKANAARDKAMSSQPNVANNNPAQANKPQPQSSAPSSENTATNRRPELNLVPPLPKPQPGGNAETANANAKVAQSQPQESTATNKPHRSNAELLKEAVAFVRREVKLIELPPMDFDGFEDTVLEISSKHDVKEVAKLLGFSSISELINSLPELSKYGTGQKLSYALAIIEKFYELSEGGNNQGPDGNGGGKSPEGNSSQQRSQQQSAGVATASANNQRSNNNPAPSTQPKFAGSLDLQKSEDAFANAEERRVAIAAHTVVVAMPPKPQPKPIEPPIPAKASSVTDSTSGSNAPNIISPRPELPKIIRTPTRLQQSLIAETLFYLRPTTPSRHGDGIQLDQRAPITEKYLAEQVAQITGGWTLERLAEEIGYSTLTDALTKNFPNYEQYRIQNKHHSLALAFIRAWWQVREWSGQANKTTTNFANKDRKAAS